MREIKFRAWDRENKRMMDNVSTGTIYVFDYARTGEERTSKEKDCDFMQYTGLKDKNGKEIYEGDIVEFIDGRGKDKGEVFFEQGKFQVMNFYNSSQDVPGDAFSEYADLEIIGNIYENPELSTPPNPVVTGG